MGEVFVPSWGSPDLTVINTTTNTVVWTLDTGLGALAHDHMTGEIFDAVAGGYGPTPGRVVVISDTTDSIVTTLAVQYVTGEIVYDSGTDEIFLSGWNNSSGPARYYLTSISGSTNSIVASISLPGPPGSLVYDSRKGEVFVADGVSGLGVVNDTTNTLVAQVTGGTTGSPMAYNFENGEILNANYGSNTVTVINDSTNRVMANLSVGANPSAITYDSGRNLAYVSNPGQGTLSILSVAPAPHEYEVTFAETGLPPTELAHTWSVGLANIPRGSTSSTISFYEPNGTFGFGVGAEDGYSITPSNGTIRVDGARVTIWINFASKSTFFLNFTEFGLPSGTPWTVTLAGTPQSLETSTISSNEPNGTLSFSVGLVGGYSASPQSGAAVVIGEPLQILVDFTVVPGAAYSVNFTEIGLPLGTTWSVSVGGTIHTASTDLVTFIEQNGSFAYAIEPIVGQLIPSPGDVVVNGRDANVAVWFAAGLYLVLFIELGLPLGTNWSLAVWDATTGLNEIHSSTTDSITLYLPNGTYEISAMVPPGYVGTLASSTLVVAGRASSGPTVITVSRGSTVATPTGTRALSLLDSLVVGGGVAIAVVAIGLLAGYCMRRSRQRPHDSDPQPSYRITPETEPVVLGGKRKFDSEPRPTPGGTRPDGDEPDTFSDLE
ncbi:MAG: YncE family protein [Thermoplasmata archaeon]|nr:YncE family protein [Thermoplasmata archaeon]